jgi:lipid-A-disaccharide synthase
MPKAKTAMTNADTPTDGPLVFISAAEPSADLHGASLIRAVHRLDPAVRFCGVAGPLMRAAGCRAVFDMSSHAAMAAGVFKAIPRALAMLRTSRKTLAREPAALAIVIDAPILHLRTARYARRAGVPVLYYIAPQLWAWGAGRIKKVRKAVDQVAVILPFEEAYYRERGVPAEYVGHPLFDSLTSRAVNRERVAELKQHGRPVLTILPGSRSHVVEEVLPGQIEVAEALAQRFPSMAVCVSVANARAKALIESRLARSKLNATIHEGENAEIINASDLCLVASGTATLEVAFHHAPMIVMYNAPRWSYDLVGRWAIRTPHLALVNILAGRELAPEFMPYYRSTAPIIAKALELLESPQALDRFRAELASLMDTLVKTGASENAAGIVMEMLRRDRSAVASPTNSGAAR